MSVQRRTHTTMAVAWPTGEILRLFNQQNTKADILGAVMHPPRRANVASLVSYKPSTAANRPNEDAIIWQRNFWTHY